MDESSLNNLRDIVEPAPVSWWPLAVGWYVLLGACVLWGLVLLGRFLRQWWRNAYRRAALKELAVARSDLEIAAVLKRTACVAYPREEVAALSGARWREWLERTGGQTVTDEVAQSLSQGIYGAGEPLLSQALQDFAVGWIRHHPGAAAC